MSRILLLTAHSIAEFDDLRMLHEIGHEVMSIGAYLDPARPQDDKRPALPEVPPAPKELTDLVVGDQIQFKGHLPDAILDWAEIVICHHFTYDWVGGQWGKLRDHGCRVIWRTCGQTSPQLEQFMEYLRPEGLQIVRYSPKERFNGPWFAGQDALIRFGMDPDEFSGWHGSEAVVGNVTQDMVNRADACGLDFWLEATGEIARKPAGPNSQLLPDGIGALTYEGLREYLRSIRTMLYTGTLPAPYTLGLIEAMMTGVPVVSIGKQAWGLPDLFEGSEITGLSSNTPDGAKALLLAFLNDPAFARAESNRQRERAIDLFGMPKIREQWRAFLA